MSVSAYQRLSWNDNHSIYLSHLYALYSEEVMWERQLCDLGYTGLPDPKYTDDTEYTPDLLAYSSQGDVQHFKLIGCENNQIESNPHQYLEREFEIVSQYESISEDMIQEYVSLHGESINVDIQERVVLTPKKIYRDYQDKIQELVSQYDIILWLIETNGSAAIWKELGNHSRMTLDSEVRNRYNSYPDGTDLLQFTRKGDSNKLKYVFIHKLVKYCSRNNQEEFTFEEVDEIMVEIRPQILFHLPKSERENKWRDCLHTLLNYIGEVEAIGNSTYKWEKSKFLTEPRHRYRLMRDIAQHLGLEEQ